MSYLITNQIVDVDFGNHALFHLAVILSQYASDDGAGIYPSNATLATKMGCTVRSVERYMKSFRKSGILVEVYSNRLTREYVFNMNIIKRMVRGVLSFGDLLGRSVEVVAQLEPQLVLPGLENHQEPPRPTCDRPATKMSGTSDTDVTQIELNKTSPRAAREADQILEDCLSAGGEVTDLSRAKNLRDVSLVFKWLESGADLERDVLPMIALRCAGKEAGSVYSWKYFERAVLGATARRTQVVDLDEVRAGLRSGGASKRSGRSGAAQAAPLDEAAIRERNRQAAIEGFIKHGYWDDQFGQQPDAAMIAAFKAQREEVAA